MPPELNDHMSPGTFFPFEPGKRLSTTPIVRAAYLIPSNRQENPQGVENFQYIIRMSQEWFREQMELYGFGPKTFTYETEEDGITPKIHIVHIPETDTFLNEDIWGRTIQAAQISGLPVWSAGEIWLITPETHQLLPNGTITGGAALGASFGSADDPGIALFGSDGLTFASPDRIQNDAPSKGVIVPEIGPYPLDLPWYLSPSFSIAGSTALGAVVHELGHALGLPHDSRNTEMYLGNIMHNGFRGIRGNFFPDKYPDHYAYLGYANALHLNRSHYFNTGLQRNNPPDIQGWNSNSAVTVEGKLQLAFSATDPDGLSHALLQFEGERIGEMMLSGSSTVDTFSTSFHIPRGAAEYVLFVTDILGNKSEAAITIFPTDVADWAPVPYVRIKPVSPFAGSPITIDGSSSTDPEDGTSALKFEWDLDGDGLFDTAPSNDRFLVQYFETPGPRNILARVTDSQGNSSISAPVLVSVRGSIASTPYRGTPINIPGTIQAEHFDKGGPGVAYYDLDPHVNYGQVFRVNEGVDIAHEQGIGYFVSWMAPGEWLQYSTVVKSSGTYEVKIHAASSDEDAAIHLEVDGENQTGPISLPHDGKWRTVTLLLDLESGERLLRLVVDEGTNSMRINRLQFNPFLNGVVAFSVDMNRESRLGNVGDGVVVGLRGNTPPLSWNETTPLTDLDLDGIYSGEINFALAADTPIQYQFVLHPVNDDLLWEWGSQQGGQRKHIFTGSAELPVVYWKDISGVNTENPIELPATFALYQNYPNPFNPSTAIRYDLPEPAVVQIAVYDLLGRQVITLVNELKTAGTHRVVFDAADLPSGIYFYRIQTVSYVETRQMTLLR